MNRIKTLLIVSLVIALSFSLMGCKLLPWSSAADVEIESSDTVPEWLTLAHRAEAAEEPEIEIEENGDEEESTETPAATEPAASQPATTQPATTQPAPAASSSVPNWQKPGTMEYVMKIQLDEFVAEYKRLRARTDLNQTEKDRMAQLAKYIPETARGIGITNPEAVFGISFPTPSAGTGSWFDNMESPTGGIFSQ